ncbi:MAG: GntR family transcriptional regulator [Paracoccaceae bacterium]
MQTKAPTQSELAYHGLRRDILECRLLPGSKVKMNYVCDTYGISLGAAREALSRLTSDGMTVMEAQKGFTVAEVSWEEYAQLTETRAEIEVSCLRKSIMNGDVEWESRVVAALHRLTRVQDSGHSRDQAGPTPVWVEAHTEFHRALVAACPNRLQLDLREALYTRSERYRYWSQALSLKLGQRDVNKEHLELAELAQSRDIEAACAAMEGHFTRTAHDMLAAAALAGDGLPVLADRSTAFRAAPEPPRLPARG